jgi:peptidoglycan hydrolase CwlO-like protein
VDEGGVALAAIQGLNQKLQEKDAKIQQQAKEIAQLQQQFAELNVLVKQLVQPHSK